MHVICDKAMGTTLIDIVVVKIAGVLTMTMCWHSPSKTSIHTQTINGTIESKITETVTAESLWKTVAWDGCY